MKTRSTSEPGDVGLTITETLTMAESELLLEMMRAGGWSTPGAAVRTSLWAMARHLGLHPHHGLFPAVRPAPPVRGRKS